MRWFPGVVAVLCACSTAIPSRAAGDTWRRCNKQTTVQCGYVATPLDPTGNHQGSTRLYVQMLKTPAVPSGDRPSKTMFLVAGGPGQASVETFDLVRAGSIFQYLFPGYDLVTYDDRGTGGSNPLQCPGLDAARTAAPAGSAHIIGECGLHLGARRSFYSTRTNAEDIDAVRRALGLDRIALYGASYGTEQVVAYALAHPKHVARLVLDSIKPAGSADVFALDSIKAIPHALNDLCRSGSCRAFTQSASDDLAKLANQLATTPIVGRVAGPAGRKVRVRIDGLILLSLAVDTDLNPGVAAELPSVVAAALAGTPGPLERLVALDRMWGSGSLGINLATEVATDCADGAFPWAPDSLVADRPPILDSAISALSPAATAPFGTWAAQIGNATECEGWPAPSGGTTLKHGPLPNVPVLILSGGRDIRTPSADARIVAKDFPKSRLVIVPGAGHAVLFNSACAVRYVRAWLGDQKHGSCLRQLPPLEPIGPFPGVSEPPTGSLTPAQTFAAAAGTLQEAEAASLVTVGTDRRLSGFRSGTLTPGSEHDRARSSFTLNRYSDASGVALTGTVSYSPLGRAHWSGFVRVTGSHAAAGVLFSERGRLSGALGGRHVSGRLPAST